MSKLAHQAPRFNTKAQNEHERQYSATKGDEHKAKELPEGWLVEVRRRRRAAT